MAKIMVIAGGDWQCPIVKTAKKMGHYVICTNLYENSPAFKYADASEVANVLDRETNLKIAQKYQPDAILTDQSDIAVPTVAYVSEKLGLRGIGIEKAELFTNKYKMRDFCRQNGYPYPKYKLCYSLEETVDYFQNEIKAKSIIKPVDSQSSRGVHIISSTEDLKENFNDALFYSNSEKAVLLEQYIDGTEFTIDGLKTKNGYCVTAISKKKHYEYNPSIAQELFFAHSDDVFDYAALEKLNTSMVLNMGLPFGLTHAEYKFMDGKFYLIEIAARGGGTRISSDITKIMSGINTNEVLINELLGIDSDIHMNTDENQCAILGFFDFKPGKIKSIKGLQEAKALNGVVDIGLDLKPGDVIENAKDDRSRCGYYILSAVGENNIRTVEQKMKITIELEYEEE